MRVIDEGEGLPGTMRPAEPRPQGVRHSPYWAIGCLSAGIGVFSLQDVIIKVISGTYPVHEVLTIRALVAMPVLLILVALDGGLRTMRSPRAPALFLRGVMMFVAYTTYYLGLASLPLATAVSLYFATPLFITLLSVLVLGEKVGPRRWAAVLVGFLGVLIMVRPGGELFEWAALLPVCAGFAYAASQIAARKLGESAGAAVMATYGNVVFLAAGAVLTLVLGAGDFASEAHPSLAFLLRGWSWPGATDLLLMMSCGLIAAIGLTLLTEAYRAAQANIVAPFEYTALIWGVLFGWLVWRELPDTIGWLGMGVIIGAGLYLLNREKVQV